MRPILIGAGVVLAATALSVGGCSGAHERSREHATRPAASGRAAASLDVPSLLALSFDELNQQLGPWQHLPPGFVDPTLDPRSQRQGPVDSMAMFRRGGLALVVAYNYRTRRVNDLLLLGSNEEELMRRAHLQLGADRYLVLPVFQARQPTQLMGLRVLALALNQ
ncbi:hypothetical protein [Hymenobacter properus]|uniref:Uncharacterized protein n=1 Tax=Hymenobacter properus TaxID=2791026 RepID=A0A931FPY0_9BACT|nr:hypothetical protein [Hymenobacter properus]MBF9144059.1 hypothetical protein [Hymenobacter properus]MBR7722875.1 hypothetical protein [Microvirga sp. SRT04]